MLGHDAVRRRDRMRSLARRRDDLIALSKVAILREALGVLT
jgi:hypothetical protein